MKLTRIPGHEAVAKQSWSLKVSTVSMLQAYHEMYVKTTGADVSVKDVVEQMLLDFMADDKAFQKILRQKESSSAPAQVLTPTATGPSPAPSTAFTPRAADDNAGQYGAN